MSWAGCFARLNHNRRHRKNRRRTKSRQLFMEPLEGRLLLTLTVQDDSLSVDADSGVNSTSFSVLDNDSSTVGPLTAAMVMPATNGAVALNPDGYFDYTPNTGFVGQDTFTYSASDGSETANGTVTVSVTSGGGGGGSSIAVCQDLWDFSARVLATRSVSWHPSHWDV